MSGIEVTPLLTRHYGFTDEEPDSIVNCDTEYRMGREDRKEEL
jgi:hypothetical protein